MADKKQPEVVREAQPESPWPGGPESELNPSPEVNPARDHTKTAQDQLDALTKQQDDMHKEQQ